jgi:hypothetical protein
MDIAGDQARLVAGVQGLLAPIRIATNIGDDDPVAPLAAPGAAGRPSVSDLSAEQLRVIRTLMAESPAIPPGALQAHGQAAPQPAPRLRTPWVFLLLGLAVGLPALLMVGAPQVAPGGTPQHWPGVDQAYSAVQNLAPETQVVVYWAYDPATSGEMDLVMEPVVRHLLARRVRLAVVSPLPGGPASARRLLARVRGDTTGTSDPASLSELAGPTTFAFLPGGAAVLPLLAIAPAAGLPEGAALSAAERRPGLVVVAAAHAEDAQDWLEQVQPLEHTPVVAVTGAGADPILRPYLDSGQLSGLVSGFDGAYAYAQNLDPFAERSTPPLLVLQIMLQNWGQLAIIAIIVLGNLAVLFSRSAGE